MALTLINFRSITFMHCCMWSCMLHWRSVFWYMSKPESLSTKTYIGSLQNIREQKNVFLAKFLEIREMKPVIQWGVDSQKHYKVETEAGCCVCYCQVYRLPTFCVFIATLYFISAELCDNRVYDKKMVIINWFYRVFLSLSWA